MDFSGPQCQSCAFPMNTEDSFGKNVDGTKSEDYCYRCYQEGKFIDEGITMEEKIDKLVQMGMLKFGVSESFARNLAEKHIPNLKRWKKKEDNL